ncbi:hypothetical protein M2323_004126 [Rhodoblastus acidophilus]|uniref:SphA family protein n=1 Tax=Rhodoblastus acidophilus TaxID=1074 RepID=UPI0022242C82|nr:transporter [Rhodoblastus acidophilus]MCW2286239.1 hypothetical protein [Rhodoblastus acidophilus]MCW2335181.1 hypothetical protein [Rhodoblastus acidophilus]
MRLLRPLLLSAAVLCAAQPAGAVEYTVGLYSLGSGAVGAGQLPPAGFYFTTAVNALHLDKSISTPFGATLSAQANIAPTFVGNILGVLPQDVLGGHLALSLTSGFSESTVTAALGPIQRSTQGWGAADTILGVALGWQLSPTFSHKISFSQWLPTGRYEPGFFPIVGMNRPGSNFSWGATYIEPTNGIEVSGTAGFTIEGYNAQTAYHSGDALHFEESISKHFGNGFRAGVYSYQYQQVTPDTGAGARLGSFEASAVAMGPTFGYMTMINDHLVSFTLQGAHEVAVKNRLAQTSGILSATYKF